MRDKYNTEAVVAGVKDTCDYSQYIPSESDGLRLSFEDSRKIIYESRMVLTSSGTATLETGIIGRPMVVIYKVNQLSYQLGKRLISVPHISLVNLIAEKEIIPELIQDNALPEKITAKMRSLFDNPENYLKTCCELKTLKKKLGKAGAPQRAADAIIAVLRE